MTGRLGTLAALVLCLSVVGPSLARAQDSSRRQLEESVVPKVGNPLVDPRLDSAEVIENQDLVRQPLANRWRRLDPSGLVVSYSLLDPYNQNPLKGDFAVIGQNTFSVLTLIANPAAVVSTQNAVDPQFNGRFVGSLEIFNGLTVFRPKAWSIRSSFQGLFNRGNADLEELELLELVGELKIADMGSSTYDFTSTRFGVQAFSSDFNGLIFNDINLGGQLFGEASRNRYRWSLAGFSQRAKSPGNGIRFDPLDQTVLVGNLIVEDLFTPGFNGQFSLHANLDRSIIGNSLDAYYVGFTSNGRIGRFTLNPTFYLAFGEEDFNPIAGQSVSIFSFLAGLQWAYKNSWITYRLAAFVASGDSDPTDDRASGFDSVLDNVALFGGPVSFVIGGGGFGTRPNSFLPATRFAVQGSGTRSNFVNPGMQVGNAGFDAILTPKIALSLNYNLFRFHDTTILENAFGDVSAILGHEANGALRFRAFLDENVVFQLGGAAFFPSETGELLQGEDGPLFSGTFALLLTY